MEDFILLHSNSRKFCHSNQLWNHNKEFLAIVDSFKFDITYLKVHNN